MKTETETIRGLRGQLMGTERRERLRAMRERLHESLSDQVGATVGIKGRAGIVLAELLDFLASEEPTGAVSVPRWLCACGWSGAALDQGVCPDCGRGPGQGLAEHAPSICAGCKSLAPGDVVRLASGGPAMTVVRKRREELEEIGGWFVCAYYQESTMEQRSVTLPPAALRRVEDEQRAEQERPGILGLLQAQRRLLNRAYEAMGDTTRFWDGGPRAPAIDELRPKIDAMMADILNALAEPA